MVLLGEIGDVVSGAAFLNSGNHLTFRAEDECEDTFIIQTAMMGNKYS